MGDFISPTSFSLLSVDHQQEVRPLPIDRKTAHQPGRPLYAGTTLVELVVVIALLTVVMGTVMPLLTHIRRSWDIWQNNSEAVQNGRVLIDHMYRSLTEATKITAVSDASQSSGYIEFEDNNNTTLRYQITSNYVEFGEPGSLALLAGPVSQLRFTCYDDNDLSTAITDVNAIRYVKVASTVTNAAAEGLDKVFTTSAYLRSNRLPATTSVIAKGTPYEFDALTGKTPALVQIDGTHYLCAYEGTLSDGWAVVLTVDPTTWTVTKGTPLVFDPATGTTPVLAQINSKQYLCAYEGSNDDGWATILTVDTGTWTLTSSTPFEYDPVQGNTPALAQIDSTHYLCAYTGNGFDGWAVVLKTSGLVGHWKLDEAAGTTAADSSGNGNDGTLTNMSGSEWTSGTVGGALEFDGSSDYVAVPHADEFLADNGTVALWFNADDVSSRGELFSKDSYSYDTGGHLTLYVESSHVHVRLQSTSGDNWVESASTLQDDTWTHVAFAWGSAGMKLYLDGSEVDTDAYTGGLGTTSGGIGNHEPLALGASTWASGDLIITPLLYYFEGTLDDVRFYDEALSAAEIAALASTLRYEGFAEAKAATDTTSVTIAIPSGTMTGDLLISAVATDGDTDNKLKAPASEGWTEINTNSASSAVTLGTWWKLAEASESSTHQFTWNGPDSEQAYGWMMRFTGHDASDPIDAYATNYGTSSTPTSPSVTSTVDNALILRLGGFDDSDITTDAPGLSGHTAITMDGTGDPVGLVCHWKFDETSGTSAADATGNGYTGTLYQMSGSEWTSGQVDGALDFDGNNDHVHVASLSAPTDKTFACWIYIDSLSADFHTLFEFANDAPWFGIVKWSGDWYLYEFDKVCWGATALSTGEWHHVAYTSDSATDESRVYLNGVDDTENNPKANTETGSGMGIAWNSGDTPFDGKIDDVRIYSRALDASEISDLYGGGGTPVGTVSGGAGYVKQASAGSSGTSTFALTATEEARMVTVAVAPDGSSPAGQQIAKETPYEFDTITGKTPALAQVDGTHYLCAYEGFDGDGWATVLIVDTGTWNITKGTSFEFDTVKGKEPALVQIDGTHYLCAYKGYANDGWAVVLTVNTGSWTVSAGTAHEFDTAQGETPALTQIDSTHYLCAYTAFPNDGWATILTVNTNDWTITSDAAFEFDDSGKTPALVRIDSSHHLCAYDGDLDDGWSVVLMPTVKPVLP